MRRLVNGGRLSRVLFTDEIFMVQPAHNRQERRHCHKISPFYNDVVIDVKRKVWQRDTISPKLFSATLENVIRELEWEDMGVKVDGQQLHHLRFAADIVLITPSISQVERMLADFDRVCGNVGL
ncbi:unnamed protein product [Heligmosomoides polygyrus]|uniref:Reverse transcriptase domain-containing protein n=1 Tax=Heligmosomoides polygyrus TaxID=6339 RepID=A0A183G6N4_HELPZ|nr:unnamed protein product [Heligmosomoides polygyrus]